jgi:hypothetical protein
MARVKPQPMSQPVWEDPVASVLGRGATWVEDTVNIDQDEWRASLHAKNGT